MNSKILICVLVALISQLSQREQVEAFNINPFGLLSRPIVSFTETFFNWNPFRSKEEPKAITEEKEEPEAQVIEDVGGLDLNVTEIKRHYFYGCECINYKCSCCAHVEVHRLKLNNTGFNSSSRKPLYLVTFIFLF